jgi:hypothetical protein
MIASGVLSIFSDNTNIQLKYGLLSFHDRNWKFFRFSLKKNENGKISQTLPI